MVRADDRLFIFPGQFFRKIDAGPERRLQPRADRHGYQIDMAHDLCILGHYFIPHEGQIFQMLAFGEIWHNAAERAMDGDLRGNQIQGDGEFRRPKTSFGLE